MPYRKKTLRRMTPQARKLAKLVGELEGMARRLKLFVLVLDDLERWQRAEASRQAAFGEKGPPLAPGNEEDLFG